MVGNHIRVCRDPKDCPVIYHHLARRIARFPRNVRIADPFREIAVDHLREDGVAEGWDDGKREDDGKWIAKGGEVRLTDPDGEVICFKRQPNGDLIMFRLEKKNGEIQILPKDRPITWKKTK